MRSLTFCEGLADQGTVRPQAFCRFSFSFFGAFCLAFFTAAVPFDTCHCSNACTIFSDRETELTDVSSQLHRHAVHAALVSPGLGCGDAVSGPGPAPSPAAAFALRFRFGFAAAAGGAATVMLAGAAAGGVSSSWVRSMMYAASGAAAC